MSRSICALVLRRIKFLHGSGAYTKRWTFQLNLAGTMASFEQILQDAVNRLGVQEQLLASLDLAAMSANLTQCVSEIRKVRDRVLDVEKKIVASEKNGTSFGVKKKKLTELNASGVGQYKGDVDQYAEWMFSVETFLTNANPMWHDLLETVESQDSDFDIDDLDHHAVGNGVPEEELHDMAQQLWAFLAGKLSGTPKTIMANMRREDTRVRALLLWKRLYKDSYGTKEARITRLGEIISRPTRVTRKQDLSQALDSWERNLQEYERLKGTAHCEFGAVSGLKQLVPAEIARLLETQPGLRRLSPALTYVREQAKILLDHVKVEAPAKKAPTGPVPSPSAIDSDVVMGTNALGEAMSEVECDGADDGACDVDVNAFTKGSPKGKGRIQGNCWQCGKQGHRADECFSKGGGKAKGYKGQEKGQVKGAGKTQDGYHQKGNFQAWGQNGFWGKGFPGKGYGAKGAYQNYHTYGPYRGGVKGAYSFEHPDEAWGEWNDSWDSPQIGSICHLTREPAYVQPSFPGHQNSFAALTRAEEDAVRNVDVRARPSLTADVRIKALRKILNPKDTEGEVSDEAMGVAVQEMIALKKSHMDQLQKDYDAMEMNGGVQEFPELGAVHRREAQLKTLNKALKMPAVKKWSGLSSINFVSLGSDTNTAADVNLLTGHEHDSLNSVIDGWEENECVIDSGAAENVAPPSIGRGYSVNDSEGSRRGQYYLTADGNKLPNLGQKTIPAESNEGNQFNMNFQIAGVTKPLMSVGKICDRGNVVTFDASGGSIYSPATGMTTRFQRKNGVYMLTAWTKVAPSSSGLCAPSSSSSKVF